MKKLIRLDLDALSVESFETASEGTPRGTVHAHLDGVAVSDVRTCLCEDTALCQQTGATYCGQDTCGCAAPTAAGQATCGQATCGLTFCEDTCNVCQSFISDSPWRC